MVGGLSSLVFWLRHSDKQMKNKESCFSTELHNSSGPRTFLSLMKNKLITLFVLVQNDFIPEASNILALGSI